MGDMKPERESPRTGERKTAGTKATVALAGKERVGDTPATSNYRRFLDEREEVPL